MLINVEMQTNVGISTFMSMINFELSMKSFIMFSFPACSGSPDSDFTVHGENNQRKVGRH